MTNSKAVGKIFLNRDLGYFRVAAAVPRLKVADVAFNTAALIASIKKARTAGVQLLVFPEMSITGYTIGDLVHQEVLLAGAERGLLKLAASTEGSDMVVIAGLPLCVDQKIFNCAAVINSGRILGIVPKTYIPNYQEFYESRWYISGDDTCSDTACIEGSVIPFGTNILFSIQDLPTATIGVEVCEDMWVPLAPHEYQALAGANILVNISASNDFLLKADWRRTMISSESGRCAAAFCYVSADGDESSNDLVFSGHSMIAEDATILEESQRDPGEHRMLVSDIDLDRLAQERSLLNTFRQSTSHLKAFRVVEAVIGDIVAGGLARKIDTHPFVPKDPASRAERCREILSMQVSGLAKKLNGSKINRVVLGVSGGLDSTLALLVAIKTMDFLKLPRQNIHAFTLPGFGTTTRTRNNASTLCKSLGVNIECIDITKTCKAHLSDLGHKGGEDIVFENIQARYRTEFLFNKANEVNAILLGTGDLTEVAQGWCTFSGDHMSHYHINVSVPKTLIRYLIRWVAEEDLAGTAARKVLYDILDTPISPELKSPVKGKISQITEDIIGPVELLDFFLYPFIRLGARPGKILFLANEARKNKLFDNEYTLEELQKWLGKFIERFFANQFKRTCMPEGPKIGSVSLSSRGDWRMPSDAEPALWQEDLEKMYRRLRT